MGLLQKLGQGAADTFLMGAGGGALGAAAGAMSDEDSLVPGMIGGASLGLGMATGMGGRNLLKMLIRQLKHARPDLPDDVIVMEAQKRAQTLGGGQLQGLYQRQFGEQLPPDLADYHARNR